MGVIPRRSTLEWWRCTIRRAASAPAYSSDVNISARRRVGTFLDRGLRDLCSASLAFLMASSACAFNRRRLAAMIRAGGSSYSWHDQSVSGDLLPAWTIVGLTEPVGRRMRSALATSSRLGGGCLVGRSSRRGGGGAPDEDIGLRPAGEALGEAQATLSDHRREVVDGSLRFSFCLELLWRPSEALLRLAALRRRAPGPRSAARQPAKSSMLSASLSSRKHLIDSWAVLSSMSHGNSKLSSSGARRSKYAAARASKEWRRHLHLARDVTWREDAVKSFCFRSR